jgi:hypothetical protein
MYGEARCTQIFNYTIDTDVPVITATGSTLNLGENPTAEQIEAALGVATIADACGANLVVTTDPVIETEPCHFSQTRRWNGSDNCLHVAAEVTRTVTWTTSGCELNGCTLGYWKNHTQAWNCYSTCTLYKDVFSASTLDANLTLQQALNLGGGGCNNLARQSVAALLNICEGLPYGVRTTDELIALVNAAFTNGTCGALGAQLDAFNNEGGVNHCNVEKSPNTTAPSAGCGVGASKDKGKSHHSGLEGEGKLNNFKVYPNPFTNTFNVGSDATDNVSMTVYDLLGRKIDDQTIIPGNEGLPFGQDYPTGVYTTLFTFDGGTKFIRIIKQ